MVTAEVHDPPGDRGRRAGHRDLQPLHAVVDARGAELRLHAHRTREGHQREAGDRAPRLPQRADPARDLRGASTSGPSSAGSSSPKRSSDTRAWGASSSTPTSNGDYTQILPWMMIVVFSVILFNLLADLPTRGSTRGSALTDLQSNPLVLRRPRSEAPSAGRPPSHRRRSRAGRAEAAVRRAAGVAQVPPAQAGDGERASSSSSSRSRASSRRCSRSTPDTSPRATACSVVPRPARSAHWFGTDTIGRDMWAKCSTAGASRSSVGFAVALVRRRSSAPSSARSPATTAAGSTTC